MIVDSFAVHFASVYNPANTNTLLQDFYVDPNSSLNFQLTVSDVITAIKSLKPTLTSGIDEIPSFLLKDCCILLSDVLCAIFNRILKSGYFPDAWKSTKIVPVYKNNDLDNILNYRPISVISNFAKIFEKSILKILTSAFSTIVAPTQHGCISKRSTATNLLTITYYINEALQSSTQVDAIYTDFSKAFYKVDHFLLFTKLMNLQLPPNLVKTLISYLTNHQSYVQYSGFSSPSLTPSSGVPQGSVLRSILFSIYINDVVDELNTDNLLFVHHFKIFSKITTNDDCQNLQNNINKLLNWCCHNKLDVNPSKCSVITFSRTGEKILYDYKINITVIKRTNTVCDLGITFSSTLNFSNHLHNLAKTASQTLGALIRNSKFIKSTDVLFSLFNTIV